MVVRNSSVVSTTVKRPGSTGPGAPHMKHVLKALFDGFGALVHCAGRMRGGTNPLSNSTKHWAAPWVLGMLGLRALIRAGFMLAPIDGHVAVVLCDAAAHGGAQHSGGHGNLGHHSHTQIDSTCPYAQSAAPAPLPELPVLGLQPIAPARGLPVQVA